MSEPTNVPTRKVTVGALGGAVMVFVAWLLEVGFELDMPAAVVAAGTTLVSFLLSYFITERTV